MVFENIEDESDYDFEVEDEHGPEWLTDEDEEDEDEEDIHGIPSSRKTS